MPITEKKDGWYWGSKGPYPTREKATKVAAVANIAKKKSPIKKGKVKFGTILWD